ncbi:MAG: tetratricopeptide repeat protein [Pyrinomonadaceae bacterium]
MTTTRTIRVRHIKGFSLLLFLVAACSSAVAQSIAVARVESKVVIFDGDIVARKQSAINAQLTREFSSEQARINRLRARYEAEEKRLLAEVELMNKEQDGYRARGSWTREEKTDFERRGRELGRRIENLDNSSLASEMNSAEASLKSKVAARRAEIERSIRADFDNFRALLAEQNKIVFVPFADVSRSAIWVNDAEILNNKIIEAFDSYATSKVLPSATGIFQPTKIAVIDIAKLRRDFLDDEKSITDTTEEALKSFAKKKGYAILLRQSDSLPQSLKPFSNSSFVAEFQTDYDAGDLAKVRRMDNFFGLNFGASSAEARSFITANKLGKINEKESSKSDLYIDGATLNYGFLKDRKIFVDDKVRIRMSFANDKLFWVRVLLPSLAEEAEDSEYYDEWNAIRKELNGLYYRSDESGEHSSGTGRGTIWRYRHPDGYDNTVEFEISCALCPRTLTFIGGKFLKEGVAAQDRKAEAEKYYRKASAYYSERKWELAVTEFTNALKLDPDHVQALHFRGHSYNMLEQIDLAGADFNAALKLDPKDADLLSDLLVDRANFFFNKKANFVQGLADANKAIQLKPNLAKAYLVRARLHCAQGKKAIAAADEETAVGLGAKVTSPCQ